MERLTLRGHKIHAIDFEITWRKKPGRGFGVKTSVFDNVSKACKGSSVRVVRPGILKIPLLDYVSVIFTHGAEIYRQIVDFKPDVIVGMGLLNTFIAMRMAKRYRIPFVYYLIDALHTLIPLRRLQFLGEILEGVTVRRSDVVCVINDELKRYAINLGADPSKVHAIKAGVDAQRFNPHIDCHMIREKLGISNEDVVLFFMGWLYSFSGLREVASELEKTKDKYPYIKLLIVGEGDLYHDLQQMKNDSGLQQLFLTGWQPYEKIPEYVAASDICLLPAYDNEIMRNIVPIKMYEYLACGKPVIATKLPGIMREFGEGNGVVYVGKPAEVLQKVLELCGNDGAMKEERARAIGFVKKYSWDKITDEFENILQATAGV
jgi:glycosyltransferase involved in cell wall biosynthesis